MNALAIVDPEIAREKARNGDLDGAMRIARAAIDHMFETGAILSHGLPPSCWCNRCLIEAAMATCKKPSCHRPVGRHPGRPRIRIARLPLLRMRALLARAHGDDTAYSDFRDRYRDMAKTLGFEGHIAWAEAMP